MNATDLAKALTARGEALAVKNGYSQAVSHGFLVGWLEAEFENALAIIESTNTPEAKRYMAHLRQRFATRTAPAFEEPLVIAGAASAPGEPIPHTH